MAEAKKDSETAKPTFGPDRKGEDSAGAKGENRLRSVEAEPSLGGSKAGKHEKKKPR